MNDGPETTQRVPPRRYAAAAFWTAIQIAVSACGVLLVYLTAMRTDACVSSCRDDLANSAIDGVKVALVLLLVLQISLLIVALLRRASPHVIGSVTVALSLVAIGVAHLMVASAYPVPS